MKPSPAFASRSDVPEIGGEIRGNIGGKSAGSEAGRVGRRAARLSVPASHALALLVAAAGCGLVSSDISRIGFNLPEKSYMFDTASWMLPPAALPRVPCTTGDECCALGATFGYDCAVNRPLICDGGGCAVEIVVETHQSIDLGREVPELAGLSGQRLADVFISKISYTVTNMLNVELPAVKLYLAPDGVTTTADGQAAEFGTVPATAAMSTAVGDVMLVPGPGGSEELFAAYARNFAVPFTFIARTLLVVRGGDPLPQGRVSITVRGQLSAQLGL
jgi:hypothetical protein